MAFDCWNEIYINTDDISIILVGYLVETAPQVLAWWGGFHYGLSAALKIDSSVRTILEPESTYKNSSHPNISKLLEITLI